MKIDRALESRTIGSGVLPERQIIFFAAVGGIATVLGLELADIAGATGGPFAYKIEASHTHLALAEQIAQGHYSLVPGVAAAPGSLHRAPLDIVQRARVY